MPNPQLQEALARKDLEAKKIVAHEMYMRFESNDKIARDLKLPKDTVRTWIFGQNGNEGFRHKRDRVTKEIITEATNTYKQRKAEYLPEILEVSIALVLNAVKNRALTMTEEPVTLSEARTISDLISNLDKLQRLDAGEATDILEERKATITIDDLKNAVLKDYFLEILPDGTTQTIKELPDAPART